MKDQEQSEETLLKKIPIDKARTQCEFRQKYNYTPGTEPSLLQRLKPTCNLQTLFNLVPILKWLPNYKKENLIWDLIAGLTVSVLQIPHGLAFAPLGGQAPVVGLYMAIFPVFIYALLGTSRHISLGMQAILVIMVGKIVENFSESYSALEVGIACTFTIGLWQAALAMMQLGSLCVLLSSSLVSGLTSAAAIHIIFFQLKHIFGIDVNMPSGLLKLIYASIEIFKNLSETNLVVLAISCTVIIILSAFNFYIKLILAKKTKYPVPMEFIIICLSVAISWGLDLSSSYNVKQVGTVPTAMPKPMLPPFELIPKIALDCLVIALVGISINISVVKVFAKKGNYEIRENQELLAYGGANIFGSLFQSLPVCTALSRSMIQFSVGGKTELVHLICMTSVLFMLFFLGPFFELVPLCVLASVVVVTMVPLLFQIKDFPNIWRLSKHDGSIWLVTFLVVIFVDLDYGIGAGLVVSIFSLLTISTKTNVTELQKIEDCYVDHVFYADTKHPANILILQIAGCVNFANCAKVFLKVEKIAKNFRENFVECGFVPRIVLNLGKMNSIDPTGVNELKIFCSSLEGWNDKIFLVECTDSVYNSLLRCKFFDTFDEDNVLLTVEDACTF